jgi:hypothetical protein
MSQIGRHRNNGQASYPPPKLSCFTKLDHALLYGAMELTDTHMVTGKAEAQKAGIYAPIWWSGPLFTVKKHKQPKQRYLPET